MVRIIICANVLTSLHFTLFLLYTVKKIVKTMYTMQLGFIRITEINIACIEAKRKFIYNLIK